MLYRSSVRVFVIVTALVFCDFPVTSAQGGRGGRGDSNDEDIPQGAVSLAFVFDITGSMYDDLVQVIYGAKEILRAALERADQPLYNYVLVPFHDPDVGPVTVTTDPDEFQFELKELYVQGGGDCPEMSVSAIQTALEKSLPNSFIYVFTDARAKDYYLTETVLSLIQQKQSQIVFVLTGDCGDQTHDGYQAFEEIASTSSGQVFLLRKHQVKKVLEFVKEAVQAKKVNLLSVDSVHQKGSFTIPVDVKLKQFTVAVSGNRPSVTLIDPAGNTHDPNNPPNENTKKLLHLKNALIVNVKEPMPGLWKLKVSSKGQHTVRVTGLSTVDFSARFARKLDGEPEEDDNRPVGGIPSHVTINATDMEDPGRITNLKIVDLRGRVVNNLTITQDPVNKNIYNTTEFTPPDEFFYVKIEGIDNDGYKLQRTTHTAISPREPVPPQVHMPEMTTGFFEQTARLTCTVDSLVPYQVIWYKDRERFRPTTYHEFAGDVVLEIPRANFYSEGMYTCNATNSKGYGATHTFLDITEPPPSIDAPVNKSVTPGLDVMLDCNAHSNVDFDLNWYFSDELFITSNQKYTIFNNGSLLIRYVGHPDEGTYLCKATNEGGTSEIPVHLSVHDKPTVQEIEPVSFVAGESIEIECEADGFPEPEFIWIRRGKILIADSRVSITGPYLTIKDAVKKDKGKYDCVAFNDAGEDTKTAQVNYIEPPKINLYEKRILVATGETARLFCKASGIPKPDIKWFKGELKLHSVSYARITEDGDLIITGTQQVDAGYYRCVATNDAGSSEVTVELEVGTPPRITKYPQSTAVDIEKEATIDCQAEGIPPPVITWARKDGAPVDFNGGRFTQLPSGSLEIKDIQPEDEGFYTCSMTNQFGVRDASAFLTVTGLVRPLIAYTNPFAQVFEGDDVELECTILQGNPKPTVQWTIEGNPIPPDPHIYKDGKGKLTIRRITPEHEGQYTCVASNIVADTSFNVWIDVQVPPKFILETEEDSKKKFKKNEGETVMLPCKVSGDPPPLFQWFKDGSPLSWDDPNYYILDDGTLEIYEATHEDTASYRCVASNVAGETEKTVDLVVQVGPTIESDVDDMYEIDEGETILLPCEVSGDPKPEVTWKKNFRQFEFRTGRIKQVESGLRIENSQLEDRAIYACVAVNAAGNDTKIITLIVYRHPVITSDDASDITSQTKKSVALNCKTTGDPVPTIEWRKDENIIHEDAERYHILDEGTQLVIDPVEVTDSGIFMCVSSNPAGSDTKSYRLRVQDAPTIPDNLPSDYSVLEHDSVIVPCPAKGTPLPKVTWYKGNNPVIIDGIHSLQLDDGSLELRSVQNDDTSAYRCVAENVVGKKSKDFNLKVLVPPRFNIDIGIEIDVNPKVVKDQSITLVCPVFAAPQPSIVWIKDNEELNTAELDSKKLIISDNGQSLTVTKAAIEDGGRYTCTASNDVGEVSKDFNLDVMIPPDITDAGSSPIDITTVIDHNVIIDCAMTGYPAPQIMWEKNSQPIDVLSDSNYKLYSNGRRLEIIKARIQDDAKYTCIGENRAGKVERDFDLHVQVPSAVTNPSVIDKEEIVTGGLMQLKCPASGVPVPEITWYYMNKPLKDQSSAYTLLDNGWTLQLNNIGSKHSGRFYCRAKNPAGESEKAFDINVLVPPDINKTNVVLNPVVNLNNTLTISCVAGGNPPPEITWLKNGVQLDLNSAHSHYKISKNGRRLKIKSAKLTDASPFTCIARNKAGEHSVDFNVDVIIPAKIDKSKANTQPKVIVNNTAVIDCPATGTPQPVITWERDGESLDQFPDIRILYEGRRLQISRTQLHHKGSYKCKASNDAGDTELDFNLDVQVPPKILDEQINADPVVVVNNTAEIKCLVKGYPEPVVTWYRNNIPIEIEAEPSFSSVMNGQQLVISNAKESHRGAYSCKAENDAGRDDKAFDLKVHVPPTIKKKMMTKSHRIKKGQTVVMYCPAEGVPKPHITWKKGTSPVSYSSRFHSDADGAQLRIENVRVTDTGAYKCFAINPAGEDEVNVDLTVLVPPAIDESNIVYNPKFVQNRTVILECPVTGIPQPNITWLVNNEEFELNENVQILPESYDLKISSVQVEHTAKYTCIAQNEAGTLEKNFHIEVYVRPKIKNKDITTVRHITENGTLRLECSAEGIPTPNLHWYKDRSSIKPHQSRNLRVLSEGRILEIRSAKMQDAGRYTCEADNVAGSEKTYFNVSVHDPPTIGGKTRKMKINVTKLDSVDLNCQVEGEPKPLIAWYKMNAIIDEETENIEMLQEKEVLRILSATEADTALYICRAENAAGTAEKHFNVDVHVPPTIEGSGKVIEESATIHKELILECPARGIPMPSLKWFRHNVEISPYSSTSTIRILNGGRQLKILNAELLDVGSYQCIAENDAGSDGLQFSVSVNIPPTIQNGPTRIRPSVHQHAILECKSDGLPEPEVIWERNDLPFPSTGLTHRQLDTGSLEFVAVRLEDSGNYTCIVTNEAGTVSRNIELAVEVPPKINNERYRFLTYSAGKVVRLDCETEGYPPPRIIWQRGRSVISKTNKDYKLLSNGTLEIPSVRDVDGGDYVCIAQNNAGIDIARVRLNILAPPVIEKQKTDFNVFFGRDKLLPCKTKGRPRPTIKWLKDGVRITYSNLNYRIMGNGWLVIPYARAEDAGQYECVATNKAGDSSIVMTLTVKVPPEIVPGEPFYTANADRKTVLPCEASGSPAPKVVWSYEGKVIEDGGRFSKDSSNLVIRRVQERDSGTYVCTARNDAGRTSVRRQLRVHVPPRFVKRPHRIVEVTTDKRLELTCRARGTPIPKITWFHRNRPIPSPPSVNGQSLLVIQNARQGDAGNYTCFAENSAGNISTYSSVLVLVPPNVRTPGDTAVRVAERVVLRCSVGGDPPPRILWLKNGRPVRLSHRVQQLRNGSLVIINSTRQDAGEYRCIATNDVGSSEGVAMLTIRRPPSFKTEPRSQRVKLGDTVTYNCEAEGEPKPELVWWKGVDEITSHNRITILANNSLRIIGTQLEDAGLYRCVASNNIGKTLVEATLTVMVDGGWSEWLNWGPCSASCGFGIRYKERHCNNPLPVNRGQGCTGPSKESEYCMERECSVNGQWSSWQPWEECSTSCGHGEKMRVRKCDSPAPGNGGQQCEGHNMEKVPCNVANCPVDGEWSRWGPWSPCSMSCGQGYKERHRDCNSPRPQFKGRYCPGRAIQRKICASGDCAVNGGWGDWSQWSHCTQSCGGGSRTRNRRCDYPAPSNGGAECLGLSSRTDFCNNEPCPVHGEWSPWNDWGPCTVSCGGGKRKRFRTCSYPAPSYGGRPCMGRDEDVSDCNEVNCPVHGEWSEWTSWTACSKTCDKGSRRRNRVCYNPIHGGQDCIGDPIQLSDCFKQSCDASPKVALGNVIGYINNVEIKKGKLQAEMSPDENGVRITATISDIPEDVSYHLQHLVSVLTPVYWSMASEEDNAFNGLSLTDGKFKRDTQVEFVTGEILKMSHYGRGIDRNGALQVDIVLRGEVPDLRGLDNIVLTPYEENYIQTGPGSVYAYSTRLFRANGIIFPYAWNHTITYEPEKGNMPFLVETLRTSDLDVRLSPSKDSVKYRLVANISPGTPSNKCPSGFFADGSYCQDDDECSRENPCSNYCHNSPGSFSCSCPNGYTLEADGHTCGDIDECAGNNNNCENGRDCINTVGSFQCLHGCRDGYKRNVNTQHCDDIDECEDGICDQRCINTDGSFVCSCERGFRSLGNVCEDINECEELAPCTHNCINTPGSYKCSCPEGYVSLYNGICRDINECFEGKHNCKAGEDCRNSLGSFSCLSYCKQGFERKFNDGPCEDVDECFDRSHNCHFDQRCVNTPGSYDCLCSRGFRSRGTGMPCEDIDECQEKNNLCVHKCQNTYGSFKCICPNGYLLLADKRSCAGLQYVEPNKVTVNGRTFGPDKITHPQFTGRIFPADLKSRQLLRIKRSGTRCSHGLTFVNRTCMDINECKTDQGCQHNCTNTFGSYKCTCPPGYRLGANGRKCQDIDECQERSVNCGEDKMCFNTRGSFTCIDTPCPLDYVRDPLTNYCVLECIDPSQCPPNSKYIDVIEFRTLALPSNVRYQDLIRLVAYDHADVHLANTQYTLLENDPKIEFFIRMEDGKGIVYTLDQLSEMEFYKITVRAKSFNSSGILQYQTTFVIHISVSAYPY